MEGPLQLFFSKYQNLKAPNESIRKGFIEAVFDVVGVSINLDDVSFNKGLIYLKSNPYIKNEVLMNKEDILSVLEEKVGGGSKRII